jgi:hypothetical protein
MAALSNLYVLPVVAFALGVLSVFVDPRDPKKRNLVYLFPLLLLLTCILQIHEQKAAETSQEEIRVKLESIAVELQQLGKYGWSGSRIAEVVSQTSVTQLDISKTSEVQQSSAAAEELTKMGPLQGEGRGVVTVEYFPKDFDPDTVETALSQLGFLFKLGTPQFPNARTNALWFGRQVTLADVKRVAFVLIRAGVQLKTIGPLRASAPSQDSLLIQVGSEALVAARTPITVEEIRNATDFSHG